MIKDNEIDAKIIEFSKRLSDLIDDKKFETTKSRNTQAEEMDIAKSNLSKYTATYDNTKKIPKPRIDQLIRIADYYNVSTDYLLGYTECPCPVNTEDSKQIRAICDYTGLDKSSIDVLHNINNKARRFAINFILQDSDLLDALIVFYLSALLDEYRKSDYYYSLEHIKGAICNDKPDKANSIAYANLLNKLPLSKDIFSQTVYSNTHLKQFMILAMAQLFVNDEFSETLTGNELMNAKLATIVNQHDDSSESQYKDTKAECEYKTQLLNEVRTQVLHPCADRFRLHKRFDIAKSAINRALDEISSNIKHTKKNNKEHKHRASED